MSSSAEFVSGGGGEGAEVEELKKPIDVSSPSASAPGSAPGPTPFEDMFPPVPFTPSTRLAATIPTILRAQGQESSILKPAVLKRMKLSLLRGQPFYRVEGVRGKKKHSEIESENVQKIQLIRPKAVPLEILTQPVRVAIRRTKGEGSKDDEQEDRPVEPEVAVKEDEDDQSSRRSSSPPSLSFSPSPSTFSSPSPSPVPFSPCSEADSEVSDSEEVSSRSSSPSPAPAAQSRPGFGILGAPVPLDVQRDVELSAAWMARFLLAQFESGRETYPEVAKEMNKEQKEKQVRVVEELVESQGVVKPAVVPLIYPSLPPFDCIAVSDDPFFFVPDLPPPAAVDDVVLPSSSSCFASTSSAGLDLSRSFSDHSIPDMEDGIVDEDDEAATPVDEWKRETTDEPELEEGGMAFFTQPVLASVSGLTLSSSVAPGFVVDSSFGLASDGFKFSPAFPSASIPTVAVDEPMDFLSFL